jgi:hypothetical protein
VDSICTTKAATLEAYPGHVLVVSTEAETGGVEWVERGAVRGRRLVASCPTFEAAPLGPKMSRMAGCLIRLLSRRARLLTLSTTMVMQWVFSSNSAMRAKWLARKPVRGRHHTMLPA